MTAADLISDALTKAKTCPPGIRKPALLWIARVQKIVDPASCVATLNEALEIQSPTQGHFDLGIQQALWLTVGIVDPHRLKELTPGSVRADHRHLQLELVHTMLEHQQRYLITYLLKDVPLEDFPVSGAGGAMALCDDDTTQAAAIVRRAADAWRLQRQTPSDPFHDMEFSQLFADSFHCLPGDEAGQILDEILDTIRNTPDTGTSGGVNDVSFSSMRALQLFYIYGTVLELRPEIAASLVKSNRELATAVKRYPKGTKTVSEEAEAGAQAARAGSNNSSGGVGFIVGGSGRREMAAALATAQALANGDFSRPLRNAALAYRADINPAAPNRAPKAFWPSTGEYRFLFHAMGERLGPQAFPKLTLIKDSDIRLFAQIELAAGMCGARPIRTTRESRH